MDILTKSNEINVKWLINSLNNMTASYKILCLKALCDEISLDNYEITYRKIVCRMIEYAFKPLSKYSIDLGKQDQLNKTVSELREKIDEHNVLGWLENNLEEKKVDDLSRYIIPLMVRPTFTKEIAGIETEIKKYAKLEELSLESEDCLYKIYKQRKKVIVNNKWFKYIKNNKSIIDYWLKIKLKEYLITKNNLNNIDEIVEEFFI